MNQAQIDFWNGPRGHSWVAEQEVRDRALAAFGDAALAAAGVRPGESVVDVGCGCGATSLALAHQVGQTGSVLGVDISEPMLARARERAMGSPHLRFEAGDATIFDFAAAGFGAATLVFSRFGVMFFDDPVAAFTNLRHALGRGGRVAFVCWRGLAENPWLSLPLAAALTVLAPTEPLAGPDAPGPLAFADPSRVRMILEQCGFREVELAPFNHPMPLGDGMGLDAAATEAMTMGPTARLLAEADDAARANVHAAVRASLAPYAVSNSVSLPAAAWVVTARTGAVSPG